MKKSVLTCLILITIMAASCSEAQNGSPDRVEVFESSQQTMRDVDSYSMRLDVDINADGKPVGQNNIHMEADIVLEPLSMYQFQSLFGDDEQAETEIYLTKESMFMYDPHNEQWMTFHEELFEQMVALEQLEMKPDEHLLNARDHIEEFSFSERENSYVFTLTSDENKFAPMITDHVPTELMIEDDLWKDRAEEIDIREITYEFEVEKETFYHTSTSIQADYTMKVEEEEIDIQQQTKVTYTDFDEVGPIEVPGEVIENAENVFDDETDYLDNGAPIEEDSLEDAEPEHEQPEENEEENNDHDQHEEGQEHEDDQ